MKIQSAIITPMPKSLFDPMPSVVATFEDGSVKTLFEYYPDEISFRASEFVGLTEQQARELYHRRDVAYLRSLNQPPNTMSKTVTNQKDALTFNKASIFDAFVMHGVATAHVRYDGSSDSGQINETSFHDKTGKEITPEFGSITRFQRVQGDYDPVSKRWLPDTFVEQRSDVDLALEELCYQLIELEHPGWEINEGSQGEFTFDVEQQTISLHHEMNIIEVEVSEHSF